MSHDRPMQHLGGETAFEGSQFSVRIERFRYADGDEAEREIVRRVDAAAVVAHDGECVWLVRQPREALEQITLELPAGKIDAGESPLESAKRELAEEIGLLECFKKIKEELHREIDKHTVNVIVSNIELLLNYCLRFYDRQFITRTHLNKDILTRFEGLLKSYYESELPKTVGLPAVSYCASELNLSANYFGDLVKKETGKTALEYIQEKVD